MKCSQEKLARKWAEQVMARGDSENDATRAAAAVILESTKPRTMENVTWKNDTHYLAGATTDKGKSVVMLAKARGSDRILAASVGKSAEVLLYRPCDLTPNENHYELRETGTTQPEYEYPARHLWTTVRKEF